MTCRFRDFFLGSILLYGILLGCRRDTSAISDEKAAYMADYESPSGKWGFINQEGEVVVKPVYDNVGAFSEGYAAVNVNGFWGYINLQGKLVIKPVFKSAWAFHEGKAHVLPFDEKEKYIDKKGMPLKTEGWSAADDFSNERARVKVGDAFGYIDPDGHLVIPPLYSRGWNFRCGICIVEYDSKLGVIDPQGNYVLNPEFGSIKISGENHVILCQKGNHSIAYDLKGKEIISLNESKMIETDGQLISVRQKDSMCLVDRATKIPLKATSYSNIIYLKHSLWAGKMKDGYVILNDLGQPVTAERYQQVNKFSDGFAAFSKGDLWGYLDAKGSEKMTAEFGLAWDYKEGLARAAFKDGIGYIDRDQKLAFYPPDGAIELRDFSMGLAPIQFK